MGDDIQIELKSGPVPRPVSECAESIAERLKEVTDGQSCKQIGEMYGISSESARRYLRDGKPSVQFLKDLAVQTKTSLDWLMLGRGPREYSDSKQLWASETRHIRESLQKMDRNLDRVVLRLGQKKQ